MQRQLISNQLLAQEDEIYDVGVRLLRNTLFERHPYRFHPLGTKETVGALTRADCVEFAGKWLVPSNMVVTVFGDVDSRSVQEKLRRAFGVLDARQSDWPSIMSEDSLNEVRIATQVMEKEQTLVMFGFRGLTYQSVDRYALDVMTAILSGMAGRLFQAIREKQGLGYTLGAINVPGWDPGYLLIYAATKPNEQERVLKMLDEQLELAIANGFRDQEVEEAKRYIIGLHRLDLQDMTALAKRSTLDELYGVGFEAWGAYEDKINSVTPQKVHDAARHYLTMRERVRVIISPNGHHQ